MQFVNEYRCFFYDYVVIYYFRERELEFIKSVNTTASYSGWLELNITGCLASWVAFPESNKGLYLSVHPVDRPGRENK